MTAKNLLSLGLLLFVGVAVVVLVAREVDRDGSATEEGGGSEAVLPAHGLVAYYFHGETRCPTCRNIESYSHDAVESMFSKQLTAGKVELRVVNYEQPKNAHFATEYELVSPTVVLIRTDGGQVVDWRNLARVWELVGEKDAFVTYIQEQIQEMLDATAG